MADAKPARKSAPRTPKDQTATAVKPEVAAEPATLQVLAPETSVPVASPVPESVPMNAETTLAKPFETVAPAIEKAAADVVAQAQAAQEQFAEKLKDMMEKNMKSVTEMSEFAKGNVEALMESAKATAAAAETLTTHMVEASKKAAEEAQAAFKSMSASKTPNEFFAAQNEYAKAQFDKAVASASHLTETWLKLAGEVVQPLSSRVALATETLKKNLAESAARRAIRNRRKAPARGRPQARPARNRGRLQAPFLCLARARIRAGGTSRPCPAFVIVLRAGSQANLPRPAAPLSPSRPPAETPHSLPVP
jgi:phasin family protein